MLYLLMDILPSSLSLYCLFFFIFFSSTPYVRMSAAVRVYRLHVPAFELSTYETFIAQVKTVGIVSNAEGAMDVPTTDRAHATRATQELDESNDGGGPGTLRSSPAHAMPAYQQNAAPTPLPEFPTLGPPIVWSFPATPMPASQPQPPVVMPSLPKTGKKHLPPPCGGGFRHPEFPPSVPFVAAEPAVSPGESEAPEMAPEPVAGGPVLPPFK